MKRLTAAGALALAFLSGCANTSVTPAQVIADLQGAVTMLRTIEPLIVLADPKALSSAQQASLSDDLDKAAEALAVLSSGLPDDAMAAGVRKVEGYLNASVSALAFVSPSVPKLAPYAPQIAAVAAILPVVETFVNQRLPVAVTARQARETLGIAAIR